MTAAAEARRHCAVCGGPLPDRTGRRGRPASWCSTECRQAAYRARRAAAQAAEDAARLRERLAAAHAAVQRAEGEMATAYGRAADAAAEPGAGPSDHLTGWPRWETAVQQAAKQLSGAALRLGELAAAHQRARADHAAALASFHRPPAPRASGDENRPLVDVDTDELFDAVEDLVSAFVFEQLPPEVAGALSPALRRLQGTFYDATGDDPGPLAAAAAAVAEQIPRSALSSGEVPPVLARLVAVLGAAAG